jgi:hypothetical protein
MARRGDASTASEQGTGQIKIRTAEREYAIEVTEAPRKQAALEARDHRFRRRNPYTEEDGAATKAGAISTECAQVSSRARLREGCEGRGGGAGVTSGSLEELAASRREGGRIRSCVSERVAGNWQGGCS